MELKPGYKQTEVGVIPEDWDIQTIGKAMKLVNGRAFKPEDWKIYGTPIIRIQNLNDPEVSFNYCDTAIEEKHRVISGDVLFAWSGTTGTSFGARIWNGPTGVLNQHIFKVLADPQKLTSVYSFLILQRVQSDIEKQAHGFKASFVHVKKSDLVKISLPLPPLPEQRAIAEALSDVDGLLAALDRLITKQRDLKQATMQQLLTGQTRLPGFTGEWEIYTGEQITTLISKGASPRWQGYDYADNGMLFITSENVRDGFLDIDDPKYLPLAFHEKLKRTRLQKGDILVNLVGASIGRSCQIKQDIGEANINQAVAVFRVKGEYSSAFIASYFQSPDTVKRILDMQVDAARQNISLSDLRRFQISIPPVSEQIAIATVLADMDAELAALEQRRDKTRLLKQAMMQELLTGRTRLL